MDRINPITSEVMEISSNYPAFFNSLENLHNRLISAVAEFYGFAYVTQKGLDALAIYNDYNSIMKSIDGTYKNLFKEYVEYSTSYSKNINAP